jgi:hypothetical protein
MNYFDGVLALDDVFDPKSLSVVTEEVAGDPTNAALASVDCSSLARWALSKVGGSTGSETCSWIFLSMMRRPI